MDPVSVFVGAVVFATGYGLRALTARPGRTVPDAGPVCGCGCSLALHNRETGNCCGAVRREHYTRHGERSGWEWVPCGCQRYTGPEPLSEVWAAPILPVSRERGA